MECEQAQQLIQTYLDEELVDEELAELQGHVTSCKACTKRFRELREVNQLGHLLYGAHKPNLELSRKVRAAIAKAARAAEEPKTQAPQSIGGFELIRKVGQGGMGAVFEARQVSMDRRVALKILPPSLAKDSEFVQRFLREARVAARLNHPNTVGGIDVGEDQGYYYFAMEFVDGESVDERLRREGPLGEAEIIEVGLQIGRALEHAASRGLVHRDVKPANILVDTRGTIKLCDLGLAKAPAHDPSLTQDGSVVGTPHYISPEAAEGRPDLDARSDMYSLGASLYHIACGQVPHDGKTAALILVKHLSDEPEPVEDLRPELSAGLCRIIRRLMAKDPADRFATPAEMVKAFEDLKEGVLIAEPARSPARARRPDPGRRRSSGGLRAHSGTRLQRTRAPRSGSALPLVLGGAIAAALVVAAIVIFSGSGNGGRTPRERASTDETRESTGRTDPAPLLGAREKDSRDALVLAQKAIQENPGDYAGHVRRLKEVAGGAAGTPVQAEAQALLAQLDTDWAAASVQAVDRAAKAGEAYLMKGDFDRAFAALDDLPAAPLDHPKAADRLRAVRALFGRMSAAYWQKVEREVRGMARKRQWDRGRKRIAALKMDRPELKTLAEQRTEVLGHLDAFVQREKAIAAREVRMKARREFDRTLGRATARLSRYDFVGARRNLTAGRSKVRDAALRKVLDDGKVAVEDASRAFDGVLAQIQSMAEKRSRHSFPGVMPGRIVAFDREALTFTVRFLSGGGSRDFHIQRDLKTDAVMKLARRGLQIPESRPARPIAALILARGDLNGAESMYAQVPDGGRPFIRLIREIRRGRILSLADKIAGELDVDDDGIVTLSYNFFDRPEGLKDWESFGFHPDHAGGRWKVADGHAVGRPGRGIRNRAVFSGPVSVELDCTLANAPAGPLLPGISAVLVSGKAPQYHAAIWGLDGKMFIQRWTRTNLPRLLGPIKPFKLSARKRVRLKMEQTGSQILATGAGDTVSAPVQASADPERVVLWALEGAVHVNQIILRGRLDPKWVDANRPKPVEVGRRPRTYERSTHGIL